MSIERRLLVGVLATLLSAAIAQTSGSARMAPSQSLAVATGDACPTSLLIAPTDAAADVDLGWTGFAHDGSGFGGPLTVAVECAGTMQPDCGACVLAGPIPNVGGRDVDNRRCSADTAIACGTDAECPYGRCAFFFGPPWPVSAGGFPACLVPELASAVTGATDLATGDTTLDVPMILQAYRGIDVGRPCPTCTGGICVGGARAGLACTVNGSPAHFGDASYDCPPLPAESVGSMHVTVPLSTGTQARTLSAASPRCRTVEFTTLKCQCDTCDDAAATPCASNADCVAVGATVCGGKRCLGGARGGAPCTSNSECAGGACGARGMGTQPNGCYDHLCSAPVAECVGGRNHNWLCAVDSECPGGACVHANEGTCENGPFETFCGPVETFRGCAVDADCTRAGDTCIVGRLRDCLDNGNVGDTVAVAGAPDPFVDGTALPTFGALVCLPPTESAGINALIGLPGLARFQLPRTLEVPGRHPTPTPAAPTPTATPVCGALPDPGCRNPTRPLRSMIILKDRRRDVRDLLTWHWTTGRATKAEFGAPLTSTSYTLCVYDETGGASVLAIAARVDAGGTCAKKPCWKETRRGFTYVDEDAAAGGVVSLRLEGASRDVARIRVRATGVDLPALPLGDDATVTVQIKNDRGMCWGARYTAPAVVNSQIEFRDRSD